MPESTKKQNDWIATLLANDLEEISQPFLLVLACRRHFDAVLATATSRECRAESELHGCVALHLDGKQELAVNRLRTALQMLDLEETERSFSQVVEWRYVLNLRAVTDALAGLALCRQLQGRAGQGSGG